MKICCIEQVLSGVYKITPMEGPAFFIRDAYISLEETEKKFLPQNLLLKFSLLNTTSLEDDIELPLNVAEAYLFSSLTFSVEKAAMTYLSRQEHSRLNLYTKLIKKGLDKNCVTMALDYLESVDYLSDRRFAGAFLRSRSIDHSEGRNRLLQELTSRGIKRDISIQALDDFFAEHNEEEICLKAYSKLCRIKKDPQKIYASLLRSGFNSRLINKIMKTEF